MIIGKCIVGNTGFGNGLANGITISSLSAAIPADGQKSAFSIYLQLWYFTGLTLLAEGILKAVHRQGLDVSCNADNYSNQMKTVQDYINSDLLNWLHDNHINYANPDINVDKGVLNILCNDKFCLKIYDRLGHRYSVTMNVANKYDENIYGNDNFSLHWAFEYFKIKQTASFDSRTESQYLKNLPNLITDIKNIIPRLDQLTPPEWNSMIEWIKKKTFKQFC